MEEHLKDEDKLSKEWEVSRGIYTDLWLIS